MSAQFNAMSMAEQEQDLVSALVGWYRGGKYQTGVAVEFFYDMDAYATRLGQNSAEVLYALLARAKGLIEPVDQV